MTHQVTNLGNWCWALAWICLLQMLALPCSGTAPIDIKQLTDKIELGGTWRILEDNTGQWRLEDILQPERQAQFIPSARNILNYGFTSSAIWVQFSIINANAKPWTLEVGRSQLASIDIYAVSSTGQVTHKHAGDHIPFALRETYHQNFYFKFNHPSNTPTTYYLRIQSQKPMTIFAYLWSRTALERDIVVQLMLLGIYFGTLLIMACYNLFLYASTKDLSYLFYTGYVIAFLLVIGATTGVSYQYLWPNSPHWNDLSATIVFGNALFWMVLFSLSYLNVRLHYPKLFIILLLLAVISFTTGFLSIFTGIMVILHCLITIVMMLGPLLFFTAIGCHFKGERTARYYLIAFTLLILSTVIYNLFMFGALPANAFTQNFMQIASILEVLLLSLGLADRIKAMNIELTDLNAALATTLAEKINAESIDKARCAFLANTSHELRTPLNAIIGYNEMLLEDALSDGNKQQVNDLENIHTASHSLLALINDILDLAKIDAGKMQIHVTQTTLEQLFDSIKLVIQPLTYQQGNTLTTRTHWHGTLHTDVTKLRQSLFNLLSNANKFTHNGHITLTVEKHIVHAADWLHFIVTDTGVGISQLQQAHVFDEFTQAQSSTATEYGGTGLGLPISRRFCRLLGGDITVQSQFGKGSTFIIRIPTQAPESG